MENNNKLVQTESPAINLLLLITVIVLLIILLFVYKSYNELVAIHDLLNKNLLLK